MQNQSEDMATSTAIWAETVSVKHKVTFTWSITDFSSHCYTNTEDLPNITSPSFGPASEPSLQFNVRLHPNGKTIENKDHISMAFYLRSCPTKNMSQSASVRVKFSLCLLNDKGKKSKIRRACVKLVVGCGYCWNKFSTHAFLFDPSKGLLPGDKLTILCEATAYTTQFDVSGYSNADCAKVAKVSENQLGDDLSALLSNPKLSDITFVVRGKRLNAHKAILMSRSAVFAAMFKHDFAENRHNIVQIDDATEEVFEELLRFIYGGKVLDKKALTVDLMALADKYQVDSLKSLCEHALSESLTVDSVASNLMFADMHQANVLKVNFINYIGYFASEVIRTEGWKALASTRPELLVPIIPKLVLL